MTQDESGKIKTKGQTRAATDMSGDQRGHEIPQQLCDEAKSSLRF